MKNPLKHRWVRALVWTAVSLVTLYVLLATWVGWTGARMWRDAQARLKAAGETIDFRSVARDPVPDDQNFCAIPALKDIALQVEGGPEKGEPGLKRKRLGALKFPSGDYLKDKSTLGRGASFGERVNLEARRDWLRKSLYAIDTANTGNAGRDVLNALSALDDIITDLAGGLDRPASSWTPQWRTRELPKMLFAITLPHYNTAQGMSQHLALRATAAARAGDAAKAHESLHIMAKLGEASMNDPFLIGLLVAATNHSQMSDAIWEVCDAQTGSAADFAKLESELGETDYLRASLLAWRGELASILNALLFMKDGGASLVSVIGDSGMLQDSVVGSTIVRLFPSGFLDGSRAVIVEHGFDHVIKPLKEEGWTAAIQSAQTSEASLLEAKKHMFTHPFHIIASLSVPATNSMLLRAVYTQCLVDQATIACALERYRIEQGSYPDSLDGLNLASGKPLPMDALSGTPMGYRKTDNGKYALWCVGFDGKDDGGKRVLDSENPQATNFSHKNYKGDWVWDFPAGK